MLATLAAAPASADVYEDIDLSADKCHKVGAPRTYGWKVGETINETVTVKNNGARVYWAFSNVDGCTPGNDVLDCGGGSPARYHVQIPDTDVDHEDESFSTITSQSLVDTDPTVKFRLRASDMDDGTKTCEQEYVLHKVPAEAVGGWGDPHLTTFDGTHYDFQSAGEFTALKSDSLELQTRQAAVPTATVPITNPYTQITHCVALFSAVATRVGSTRVTLQPRPGEAVSKSMLLRVNGKEVDLTDRGIELIAKNDNPNAPQTFDGRIKKAQGGSIEIVAADGAQIVVTPDFWESMQLWYLNVKVHQSAAKAGTMGEIHEGEWLPLLPDGTALGPKPEGENDRYQQLYETFADAWRVTDATSLFDYEAGTNTATYTLDEWPRNNPQNCGLPGQTPAQPATQAVAEQACANVTNPVEKADCIFDVAITGNTGFGKSYENMQKFEPHGAGWQTHVVFPSTGNGGSDPGASHGGIPLWLWILLIILILILLIWFFSRKKSTP